MAKRRFTRNRGVPKRATLWLPFSANIALQDSGVQLQSADLLTNFFTDTGQEIPVGTTIGPIRGRVLISSQVPGASQQTIQCAIAKVPESSWSGVPDPGNEIMDGMWYGAYYTSAWASEFAAGTFKAVSQDYLLETSAKRKITATGQELRLVAVANSGDNTDVDVAGFVLLMLP